MAKEGLAEKTIREIKRRTRRRYSCGGQKPVAPKNLTDTPILAYAASR